MSKVIPDHIAGPMIAEMRKRADEDFAANRKRIEEEYREQNVCPMCHNFGIIDDVYPDDDCSVHSVTCYRCKGEKKYTEETHAKARV